MKTLAFETFMVAQSIVFWLFAFPFALVAFPLLTLGQKAAGWFSSPKVPAQRGHHLTARYA